MIPAAAGRGTEPQREQRTINASIHEKPGRNSPSQKRRGVPSLTRLPVKYCVCPTRPLRKQLLAFLRDEAYSQAREGSLSSIVPVVS